MKKILMVAVMAAAAVSANAQWWIGGELGINTNSGSTKNTQTVAGTTLETTTDDNTNVYFEISPEVGYNLSDKWAVALALSFSHSDAEKTNAFSVKPYVRYTFLKAGNFSAFCDGGVTYKTSHIRNDKANTNTIAVGLNPGVTYAVSPKVTLVAHLGDLSYQTSWKKYDESGTTAGIAWSRELKRTTNNFNFGLWNAISFGAYYNF